MAYVSISQDLRNAVRSKINNMKDMERKGIKCPESIQDRSVPVTPELEQLVWGEHYHLKPLMPQEWLRETESANFITNVTFENGASKKVGFRVIFPSKMATPPNTDRYGHEVYLPADHPAVPDLIAYHTEMRNIDKRWADVGSQIMEFLGACKSLNQAIKLWPDVRIYIPEEYLERAERKVERSVNLDAVEAIKKVDTDAAISAAAIARMMGAIGGH